MGWLLPLTYLAHIAEEYWGGVGFPEWISSHTSLWLTTTRYLQLNTAFWMAMSLAVLAAALSGRGVWLLVPLSTVVLINGLLHMVSSIATRSYSPGLVTGLVLWVPLGGALLFRLRSILRPVPFFLGAVAGVLLQGVVAVLAFR